MDEHSPLKEIPKEDWDITKEFEVSCQESYSKEAFSLDEDKLQSHIENSRKTSTFYQMKSQSPLIVKVL